MSKSTEQTTTVTYTPDSTPYPNEYPPRRQVRLTVHSEPRKRAQITVSVPTVGQRDEGWKRVDLRDADDLRTLAEVATEAYRDLTEGDDDE